MKLSIVIPCYNEEASLPIFYEAMIRLSEQLQGKELEMIFIDDGSKDRTLSILRELSDQDERVNYLSFSRNFGKEAGMYAGLEKTTGDLIAVMDVDMQDPPELLLTMIQEMEDGEYDSVATRRVDRKGEPPIRSFFARCFYKVINRISKADIVDGARDFRIMSRRMVDSILSMTEYNRFSKGIFGWVGYRTKWIPYVNVERVAGETKWSFWKLFLYSIEGIIAFSTAPLALASVSGLIFCLISFVMILVIIAKTLMFGDPVSGWPSLVCILLLVSGVQLFSIGILGQYMAKTYMEVKKRPLYFIKEKVIRE